MSTVIKLLKGKFILAFLLSFLFFQSNYAQGSGLIRGIVYEKNTNEPLAGANVMLIGTSLGAASDLDGKFVIRSIPVGSYTVTVSYIGYNSVSTQVNIQANKTIEQDFYLEAKTITGETIVITAQAEGQLSAINQQLSSNTIENVVSKARIKELPDVNAAESIGRLPGVSIQRYGGEATKVEVRGLNPKYSLITVNGVELPATGSQDRSVDLSLVSSNMLDGISLKKSVTPDMNADVLGGTIDLKLREATPGMQINASAQGGYNALQKYYGNYSFTGNASNRFLEDKLGVILNINMDNYDRSADKFSDEWRNYPRGGNKPDTVVSQHLSMREEKLNRKRAGASLLIDYIIPGGKVTANGFFNQLKSEGTNHIDHFYTPDAAYSTNRRYYQLEQFKSTTNVYTSAISLSQDYDWIRFDFGASRTGTVTDEPNRRSWQFNQETGAVDAKLYSTYLSPQAIAKTAYIDTNKAYFSNLYINKTRLIENTTATQFNVQVPFRITDQISGTLKSGFKLRWIDRRNDQSQAGNQGLQYGSGSGTLNPVFKYLDDLHPEWGIKSVVLQQGGLTIRPFLSDYRRDNFLNNEFPLGPVPEQSRLNEMMEALLNAPSSLGLWLPRSVETFGLDYDGIERHKAVYVMGEFNLGDYLTFIPGVRWEEEDTRYNGQRFRWNQSGQTNEAPPTEYLNLSKIRKNRFLLPMVNLIVKPIDWLQVRLARTETIARPNFNQYAPISYVNTDNSQINMANYSLKPARSTNYDMSLSVFNNDIGLFSASAFYKNVKDLIFYSTFKILGGITPDPILEIPEHWYKGAAPQVSTNRNNPNPAKYYGFELEWQTHFWYLPSILNGLVLNINYAHIYSEMELQYDSLKTTREGFPPRTKYSLVPRTVKTRMPDQPAYILNITIGYDYETFSARLSYLYQTDKLTSIGYDGTLPTTRLSTYSGAYGRWDLTLQQKIDKNFQVFANFNNLNNRRDQNLVGANLQNPSYIEYYGFTMDIGLRYNL